MRTAILWGEPHDGARGGLMVEIAAGTEAVFSGEGEFRAALIVGQAEHRAPNHLGGSTLDPGSYFGSRGGAAQLTCQAVADCVVYVQTSGRFAVASANAPQ